MYSKTYEYYVNPAKRLFCSDAQGTPITDLPTFYFGERPVFTMTFDDGVLVEGEKLVFVMDNENRFLDSHSITGLEPVMAWCVHEITAEDVQNKSIDLELYCFGRKYADVINGHDNAVTCILSLFIKSLDDNLNCTFSTLATTLAYAEPTIVSPDCVFDELPIDMYLTRDEMNALIAEVESIQREAIAKAEQARQSAAVAEAAALEASQIAKDLKPLQLSAPPTTSTSGSVGQLAVWHDSATNKDHLYHLCFVSEGESTTLYHWEECVLVSMGNVAGGYPVLNENGKIDYNNLPLANNYHVGAVLISPTFGITMYNNQAAGIYKAPNNIIDAKSNVYQPIVPSTLDYAVRSVLPNVTEIPAATSDYSLVDSSATTNNHSHVYSHAPTTAPTYRLPQFTNTTIAHYIELTVDFTAVQTYSFLDNAGEPIVPLFTPAIAAGDVYTFKMEYSAIKAAWLIYPQKQGAVADDFVMRGEVGAANGVVGLDGNGLISSNELPAATNMTKGAIVARETNGFRINEAGWLTIQQASYSQINARNTAYNCISAQTLNYAVTAAITDVNHITLNDAQKATAQSVFGVGGPITAIPAATTAYTLAEGIFTHAPTSAPTYTLPNITDDIRTHEVVLIIDFSSVQTFSFLVDGGGDVTFQSYANPTMGDVWAFRCWWYGGKWRIAPTKIKNCVTRQLTNGSLAITDAVAGDALALKMTAPRSVVVNQLVDWKDKAEAQTFVAYHTTISYDTDFVSIPCTSSNSTTGAYMELNVNYISSHTYALVVKAKSDVAVSLYYTNWRQEINLGTLGTSYSTLFKKFQPNEQVTTRFGLVVKFFSGTVDIKNDVMLVDLTQYFNGDTTLINSITSWDDLVAYDPRFAQYVEYNTGEVSGVQPMVKVCWKNLFNKNNLAAYTYQWSVETVDDRNCIAILGSNNPSNTSGTQKRLIFNFSTPTVCSLSFQSNIASGNGYLLVTFYYSDGTMTNSVASQTEGWSTKTFTSNTSKGVVCVVMSNGMANAYSNVDIDTIQLELGSSATTYEPYHDGGTAQATAPLFAVGNAADEYEAVGGATTKRIGSYTFTGEEWWGVNKNYPSYFYCNIPDAKPAGDSICSAYITYANDASWTTLPDKSAGLKTLSRFYIHDSLFTEASEIAAHMAGKTIYYELATSITSASTPAQISLQAGNNVAMQTDGGRLAPIDITYESDEL